MHKLLPEMFQARLMKAGAEANQVRKLEKDGWRLKDYQECIANIDIIVNDIKRVLPHLFRDESEELAKEMAQLRGYR